MKGQTMFNYPRKIYNLEVLRKKTSKVIEWKSVEKKKVFLEWLLQFKMMSSIHQGDGYQMTMIDIIDSLSNSMLEYKRGHCYHEKHGAWVIERPSRDVNLGGGSWFYPQRFATEDECLKYIKDNF